MSICLLAIPVALSMRAVLGEKKFNEWIEAHTMRLATNFNSADDLVTTVKKAGFDVEAWGDEYKTHIDKNLWFLWEKHEGKWQANFNKSDDQVKIKKFFHLLQKRAGRQILYVEPSEQKIIPTVMETLPTIFTDQVLLRETLEKYGAQNIHIENSAGGTILRCVVDHIPLEFVQKESSVPIELNFRDKTAAQRVYESMRNLNEVYRASIQENTYLGVKKHLQESDIRIENEEILEDNSIVLTISI